MGMGLGLGFGLGLADIRPSGVGTPWWLEEGVNPAVVRGAWQGKGAASYAASLVNLNDPGVRDLIPAGNPTWTAANGWSGLQAANHFSIDGGWMPAHDAVTVLLQFTNAASASMQFCGASEAIDGGGGTRENGISINNAGAFKDFYNWGNAIPSGGVTLNGNLAIAGKAIFINGVKNVAVIGAGTGTNGFDWYWGAENWSNTPHGGSLTCQYVAFAAYDAVLTDDQVAAIAARMAAL